MIASMLPSLGADHSYVMSGGLILLVVTVLAGTFVPPKRDAPGMDPRYTGHVFVAALGGGGMLGGMFGNVIKNIVKHNYS